MRRILAGLVPARSLPCIRPAPAGPAVHRPGPPPLPLLLCALLACLRPAWAEEPTASAPADAGPSIVKSGIYLMSLDHVDPSEGTFAATFWIWYTHQPNQDLNLLRSREFLNAREVKVVMSDVEEKGGVTWAQEKVQAVFTHDFDLGAFPYDRHELRIVVEEALMEASELQFAPDTANAALDERARGLDGWKVGDFRLETLPHQYTSNFGDPTTAQGSVYHQLVATVTIERNAKGLLQKITFSLYIAFLIAVVAFFMKTSSDDIFASRIGLLVGMIFATLLSNDVAAGVVGGSLSATLPDKLHNVGLSFLMVMVGLTLVSRRLAESGREKEAVRLDRTAMVVLALGFALVNYLIIERLV